jgi:hypothetical protein
VDVERGTWNGRSWKRLRGTPNSAPKKEETYPAENLFYCHYYLLFYCPKAFRTKKKRHNEKEYADFQKTQMTLTLRLSTRMREPAQDLVNGNPPVKELVPQL